MDAPFSFFLDEGDGDGFSTVAAVFVETLVEEFSSSVGNFIFSVEVVADADFGTLASGVTPVEGGAAAVECMLVAFSEGSLPGGAVAFHGSVVVHLSDFLW